MSKMRNLALERATFAMEKIEAAQLAFKAMEDPRKREKEFKSHIKDIPMMIRLNGLAAAFAFVFSKAKGGNGKPDYEQLNLISQEWLRKQGILGEAEKDFAQNLIKLGREDYRRATHELLSLFTWLKRYADGLIADELAESNSGGTTATIQQ